MLGEKLNMSSDEAERWIVNLIRNANLDAKIDSQQGTVVMGSRNLSPYDTIIERTKNLFNRTCNLTQTSVKKRDVNVDMFFENRISSFSSCFRPVGIVIKPNNPKPVMESIRSMNKNLFDFLSEFLFSITQDD